jgi:translocation and assembly module TamB
MTSPSRPKRGFLRATLAVVAMLLVLLIASVLFLGFVPAGNRLLASMVSSLLSGPGQTIAISAPRGLLTGHLQLDEVRLSDSQGQYAEARNIAVDWSPLSLLRGTFHADRIDIGGLTVNRQPVTGTAPASADQTQTPSSFSLPVAIEIDAFNLPDIELAPALTGRRFELSAEGSANATDERVALKLSASRKDAPNAVASADLVFAPGQNELKLEALVAEPQGGLLARLLHLPGAPALALELNGLGSLSNWTGQMRGTVDGEPVIDIDGQHTLTAEGAHRLQLKGGGQLADLMPQTFRPLFAGRTDINIVALIAPSGRLEIRTGELNSGALRVAASGALDPSGDNSLTASATASNGPVAIDWPINGETARLAVENLNFTLTGPAESSRFNATAALRSISTLAARFEQVRLQAESEDLNLVERAGSIRTRLSAGRADFTNPDLDRLIEGPLRLDAPIRLALPAIGLDAATFESGNASGTISGAYNLSEQSVKGNLRLSLSPNGLPEAAGRYFADTIGLEAYLDGTIGGRMSVENVVLKSGLVEGHGNLLLDSGNLEARLAGRFPDIARLRPSAKGPVGYDVTVNGPLDALTLNAAINAADLRLSGRTLEDIRIKIAGLLRPDGPEASLEADGRIDGKPLSIKTRLEQTGSLIALPEILVEAGANRLTGALNLSTTYLPEGRLSFDLPDVGLLAAFAGQQASGDLEGTLQLSNAGDVLAATINASGETLTAQGTTLQKPVLELTSSNVLALDATGTIRAEGMTLGSQQIRDLVLSLQQQGDRSGFDLSARYSDAPLILNGAVERTDAEGMTISLDRFSAKPAGIDLALQSPARIRITENRTDLGTVTLNAGGGTVVVEGSAADQLNVAVRISELPAALANSFVDTLGAEGVIGGAITIAGTASAPVVRYSLQWQDAQVSQTRSQNLQPLELAAQGRFENNVVTLTQMTLRNGDGISASASGTLSAISPQRLDVNVEIASMPAALANRFRPDLDLRGTLRGTAKVTGTIAEPMAAVELTLSGASIAQTRAAGLEDLTAAVTGRYQDQTFTLSNLRLTGADGIEAEASGTVSLTGERAVALDASLGSVPLSLVNVLRPDLDARGSLSGTLTATGTLSAPQAKFDLSFTDASLAQTRSAGMDKLALAVQGSFIDQTVTLGNIRLSGPQDLSLNANGTVGLSGDRPLNVTAEFSQLPASLADVARADLNASGRINGRVVASGTLGAPALRYDVSVADAATAQSREAGVTALDLSARGTFEQGVLTLEDTRLSDPSGLSLTAAGRVILQGPTAPALDLNATIAALPANLANSFVPDLNAGGVISGTVSSTGSPEAPATQFDLQWQDAQIRQTRSAGLAGLTLAAKGGLSGGTLTLQEVGLTGPSGLAAKASGSVGLAGERALNVSAEITALPASLAGAFLPAIQMGGTVTGSATVGGTIAAPAVRYDLQWADGVIRRQGDAGVSGLNLKAAGNFQDGRLTLGETRLRGPQGLSLDASGNVVLGGETGPQLDLNADINAVPASLANAFAPGLGASGQITGKVSALPGGGTTGARFDLTWSGASLTQTRSAGLQPFTIAANGTLQNNRVNFETRLTGTDGLSLSGGGSVGLTGERPLNLRFEGGLPFGLAAAQLSGQGLVLNGQANVNIAVGGTVASPSISGAATTAGAQIIDVRRNLALNNINASVSFDGNRATISSLTADVSTGGSLSMQGSVGLTDGFAADLRLALDNATYVDGNLVTATVNGALNVTGPLLSGPTLGGNITLVRANITVPAKLPASLAEIDVKHRNAPADVCALLASLQPKGGNGTSSGIKLDLTLNAPNGIFVRGRGIDAELGGSLTIRGSTNEPNVVGAFTMRRGRIIILTKRLEFTTGKITFGGSLIPVLDMVASTSSGQTTININVSGVANDPDISFSSSPSLPQDEVLAQLIFGQSMSRLSPLQIAQLADAASQLAGGGDTSLLQTLRSSLGVDDLDINTDETGQTSVSVGRYINNRTYFQLEQGGSSGGARATINLDIGRGVKLKGSAGSDGGSGGIFYEKEY